MVRNIWDKNWKINDTLDIHPEIIRIIAQCSRGKKILEVGFGSGGDIITLSNMGFDCYGIDTSIIACKRLINSKKIKTYCQDGRNTSFNDNEFDLVYHQGLLEHFTKPEELLHENYRILKTGGYLIVDVPHKWNLYSLYKKIKYYFGSWYGGWETSYDARGLRKIIEHCGFEAAKISYRGIFPHQLEKVIFPDKIINKKNIKNILTKSPIKYLQKIIRYLYDRCKTTRIISSYNIIIVAVKK